ncbi:hypothetical protein, conserved [Leishmania tarentolae]|uniref:Uncharacterized protein n=1 Tax=Leishmania tarentolae TaxID=5689 RepID=A0A640K8U9_LEITA|nr:hypothetical protein, conserved [Leishmania tarentolae]
MPPPEHMAVLLFQNNSLTFLCSHSHAVVASNALARAFSFFPAVSSESTSLFLLPSPSPPSPSSSPSPRQIRVLCAVVPAVECASRQGAQGRKNRPPTLPLCAPAARSFMILRCRHFDVARPRPYFPSAPSVSPDPTCSRLSQAFAPTGLALVVSGAVGLSSAPLTTTTANRSVEAALLRREGELRSEYYRLYAEDQWHVRQQREAKRLQDDEAERKRLMELARMIEEERTRRVAEQQERLLQKERELEEWKLERRKDAEAERRRQQEEDDRRRELQHERELACIKEEAASRAVSTQKAEEVMSAMEQSLQKMQSTMQEQLREEVRVLEAAHRSELTHREGEWVHHVKAMEMNRSTELAELTHQLKLDQSRAARSEEQLCEARSQLTKLLHEVDQLRLQLQSGGPRSERDREAAEQLAETHRSAVERLQQMYEDDKRAQQHRYAEERDRIKYEQDRRLEELKDSHAAAMRCKDVEIDHLSSRVRQLESQLQDEGVKLALLRSNVEQMMSMDIENARMKDEVRQLHTAKAELEETKKRLERNLREAESQMESQSKQLRELHTGTVSGQRQLMAERDELRRENVDLKSQLSMARTSYEEEVERLQKKLKSAEEAAAKFNVLDMEQNAQKAVERADEARRSAEKSLAEATRKLKLAEEEAQSSKRSAESAQRDVAQARNRIQELQEKLGERAAQVRTLETELQGNVSVGYEAREAKERLERLQAEYDAERESRRRQYEAALEAKDREVQQCRTDLLEVNKKLHALREECASSKFDKDGHQQRLTRQLTEREEEVAHLRRQLEDSRQSLEQWKATYEELQQRSGTSTNGYQKAVHDREEELQECRRRLRQVQEEKTQLEKRMNAEETARISATAQCSEVQRLLREREGQIQRLEQDVRELRAQPVPQSVPQSAPAVSVAQPLHFSGAPSPLPSSALKVPPLSHERLMDATSVIAGNTAASYRAAPTATLPASASNELATPAVHGADSRPTVVPPAPAAASVASPPLPPPSIPVAEKPPTMGMPLTHSFDHGTAMTDTATEGTPLSIPVPVSLSLSSFQVGRQSSEGPSLTIAVPTPAGALSHTTSPAQYALSPTPVAVAPRSPHGGSSSVQTAHTPSVPTLSPVLPATVITTGSTSSFPTSSPAAPPPPPAAPSSTWGIHSGSAGVAPPVPVPVISSYPTAPVPTTSVPSVLVPAPSSISPPSSAGGYSAPPVCLPLPMPVTVPFSTSTSVSPPSGNVTTDGRHGHRSHRHHHRS